MPKRTKRIWTDGLKGEKTATNPKGGGRVKGRVYPNLTTYPGIQGEMRLAWNRMRAQAKFRKEIWTITWEEFLEIWEGKWYLRGTTKESVVLTKIDQDQAWTRDNVEICPRLEQWRRQHKVRGPARKNRSIPA